MTDVIAVVTVALLFVLFGVFVRARPDCAGPSSCSKSDGHHGCGGCALKPPSTEIHDA